MTIQNVAFIDSRVAGYRTLIAGLGADTEWHLLDPNLDGVEKMQQVLSSHAGLDSVQIISHGSAATLYLGSTVLNGDNLSSYQTQLQVIGASLSASGDILIYGCNVAQGDVGVNFVKSLAELTRADIAASDDLTGNENAVGADGDFEVSIGTLGSPTFDVSLLEGVVLGVPNISISPNNGSMQEGNSGQQLAKFTVSLSTATSSTVSVNYGTSNSSAIAGSDFDASSGTLTFAPGEVTKTFSVPIIGDTLYESNEIFRVTLSNPVNAALDLSGSVIKANEALFNISNDDGELLGVVTTDFGTSWGIGASVTVQADGKILVAGSSGNGIDSSFALVRYNADGTLDSTFSGDGILTTDIGMSWDDGDSVTLQADGKILVAGASDNGSNMDFALVRYTPEGTLDTTFSADGIVTTDIGTSWDAGASVTVQADGKILITGSSWNGSAENLVLVRYNADGTLDTSFSGDGIVTTSIRTGWDTGRSVTVQADGKILVVGSSWSGSDENLALLRYNSDGTLDTTFSGDGIVTADFGTSWDSGASVRIQSDGKILVTGSSWSISDETISEENLVLVRYNADGTLDNTFSDDGVVASDIGTGDDSGPGVAVQADGKILVTGSIDKDSALMRYNADGTLDTTFSGDGIVTTAIGMGNDLGTSVTVQADGKILVAGTSSNENDDDFALVRYNHDGTLDTTFGSVILNHEPTGSVTISGTPTQGQTLTAANTLADVDGLGTISYQWMADGGAIPGVTEETLTLTQAEVGKVITVTASYVDGYNTAENVTSSGTKAVANLNDLQSPQGVVVTAIPISGYPGREGTTGYVTNTYEFIGSGNTDVFYILKDDAIVWEQNLSPPDDGSFGRKRKLPTSIVGTDDGLVYTAYVIPNDSKLFSGGVLEAHNFITGQKLWSVSVGYPGVYYLNLDERGDLYCSQHYSGRTYISKFDGKSGLKIWNIEISSDVPGVGVAISVTSDEIYAGLRDEGRVFKYDLDGEFVWGSGMLPGLDQLNGAGIRNILEFGEHLFVVRGTENEEEGYHITVNRLNAKTGEVTGTFIFRVADFGFEEGLANGVWAVDAAIYGSDLVIFGDLSVSPEYQSEYGVGELFLASISVDGVVKWAKHFGGAGDDFAAGYSGKSLYVSDDGTVTAFGLGAGTTSIFGVDLASGGNYFIFKYSPEAGVLVETATRDANVDEEAAGTLEVTGTAAEDSMLTASLTGFSDPDGEATIKWQWQISNDGSTGWSNLIGANSASYVIASDQSQVGKYLRVVATTTDTLGGTTTFTGSASAQIANVNDAPTGIVGITGTAQQGQTLTASNDLADAEGMGAISYQWNANGTAISGATDSTLTLTQAEVDKTITVTASYIDGRGMAESVTSAATTPVTKEIPPPTSSPISLLAFASETGVDVQVWIEPGIVIGAADLELKVAGGALQGVTGVGTWTALWQQIAADSYTVGAFGLPEIGGSVRTLLATLSFATDASASALLITLVEPLLGIDFVQAPPVFEVPLKADLSVTAEGMSVTEAVGALSLVVELAAPLLTVETLNWVMEGVGPHGATAADFVGGAMPSGTLTFAAGETRKTITVTIADDVWVEYAESFRVRITKASGGVLLDTDELSDAVTITDDDRSLASINALTPALSEAEAGTNTSFSFKITLDQAPVAAQSLSWSVTGSGTNTAAAADFVGGLLPQGVVTFAAGETEKLIQIVVQGDDTREPDEGFSVSLSAPSAGIALGELGDASAAILSDDLPAADLSGQVLTRKGQSLPEFEAQLTLTTLEKLDFAVLDETPSADGGRTLRFALTIDSATQAFGAFNLSLATGQGVEIVGLALGEPFAAWQSLINQPDAQRLALGAYADSFDPLTYPAGEIALGVLTVRVAADHVGPVRVAIEELVLGTAAPTAGMLHYQTAPDNNLGGFEFLGLEDGQIDLQFLGDISIIGRSITAQDALEALRLAVRIPSGYSHAYGLISADYNQDGRVTSQDALEILKTSVRMPDAIQPQWVFLSDEADLSALSSRNTGYETGLSLSSFPVDASHNFTAVLLGDVNDSLTFV